MIISRPIEEVKVISEEIDIVLSLNIGFVL